jgi:hypothetical protein
MSCTRLTGVAALTLVLAHAWPAPAQAQPLSGGTSGWQVSVYPIFVWVPAGIDISVEIPPDDGGGGGSIVDSRFDGAYLGGLSADRGNFRFDVDAIWAGFGGDRPELPFLTVDADLIYFHATAGPRIAPNLYVVGGVRRVALKYNVTLGNRPEFERTPGVWDPIVGLGWHRAVGNSLAFHSTFEYGGFGVGSDVDLAAGFRLDWKMVSHFGFTAGYQVLYLKVTDDAGGREFGVKQTLHGPIVGIGLYF